MEKKYMRAILVTVLATSCVMSGCGASYPAAVPSKTVANPAVEAQSLKSDLMSLLERTFARDDVIIAEADKAKKTFDQARLYKQAYYELFKATSLVQEEASGFSLNPFEAKKRKEIRQETATTLWKLRYLEKEGGAKANDDEARFALYERLHKAAYDSLNQVKRILEQKG